MTQKDLEELKNLLSDLIYSASKSEGEIIVQKIKYKVSFYSEHVVIRVGVCSNLT